MDVLAAMRRQERRLERQFGKPQHQFNGLRAAAKKTLGDSTNREIAGVKKRVLSAAGRAKGAKTAKKRWAKVRLQAKKVAECVARRITVSTLTSEWEYLTQGTRTPKVSSKQKSRIRGADGMSRGR